VGSRSLPPTLRWEGEVPGRLLLLDQTLLPAEEREIPLDTPEEVIDAIRRLAVRGAPAIGIAAAYGLVLAAQRIDPATPRDEALARIEADRESIAAARPTAVNLSWALDRQRAALERDPAGEAGALARTLLVEARAIHEEDRAACEAMARHALALVRDGGSYLTHCNAGALATGGLGTALGVFHLAAREGVRVTVFADETRPLLQGARLTAWELDRSGVDVVLMCDSAASTVLTGRDVDAVFVGSDRIAANGDVANKLGTLSVALAARRAGVPFYVVAPPSTFDLSIGSGEEIPIEERADEEVTEGFGPRTAPDGVRVYNPAFDVTPADLVTAIVTERGIIRPVSRETVAAVVEAR
jgi:methylthioribose-1-phosphate isomerase